jgi:hypothetical protein
MTEILDVLEVVRAVLDAVDKLAEHALRVDGSVEAQQAATLARKETRRQASRAHRREMGIAWGR